MRTISLVAPIPLYVIAKRLRGSGTQMSEKEWVSFL
jgi:hypothetical protein